jgi:predicted aldo/keto reductase-like oxidoreductase
MAQVTLGMTGITTNKNGFGALPIQRISKADAVRLMRKAYDGGITFYDTARVYSDSEEKVGAAFDGMREKVFLASKAKPTTGADVRAQLETTLRLLKTDYLDIYQLHNPAFCPKPGDGSGLYEALAEAKKAGKIRHIGITNHRLHVAHEAIDSGLYETLQFPLSYLSSERDLELVQKCKERNMGFIAMKALSGGLITNSAAAYAYFLPYDNVLPIWGIQRESELDEFLRYVQEPPVCTPELLAVMEKDRTELSGDFCRGCGYCLPCPAEIRINECARMSLFLRRSPSADWLSPEWQKEMEKIESCLNCGHCKQECPYGLDTPTLLRKNLEDYRAVVLGQIQV